MKKEYSILLFCCFLMLSCAKKQDLDSVKISGNVFGTTYHITYVNTNVSYQKSIDSLFYLVNKSLSSYIPTSDISKINKGDSTVVVDAYFTEVMQKSVRIFKETDGYFDPTVGKLIDAYGFGSGQEKKGLTDKEVKKLMENVGFDKVTLKNRKVFKESSNIEFNVNAFAKGYGLDVVGRFFESKNINNYLIEIGGEIRARGKNIEKLWRVAIEKPNVDGTRSLQKVIELDNESMATSGNYRKYKVNSDGKKIVHTINAKTGLAEESNLLSVSVRLKGDCADVDAYATAFLAMGLEKTKAFLKKHTELKVVLLYHNNSNELVEFVN